MKAVVYRAPGVFDVASVPEPQPGPGEVLLQVSLAGMCGTDLHIHDGGFFSAFPLTPGHEITGVVAQTGDGVTLAPGTLVAADNTVLCGHCPPCQRDEPLFCENFYSLGVNGPGAFAEFVLVRAEKCFPVGAMDPRTAVMTEPVACAVHGIDVLDLRPGSSVLVFGAGPSGLVLSQLLLHGGAARLTVAAPTKFKLDLAAEYGADATVLLDREHPEFALDQLRQQAPGGFDAVVDATGVARLTGLSMEVVRNGGTVLVYGMADEQDAIPFRPYEVFRRQLTIKGSFAQTHCFERALRLLSTGRVRTDGILTHVLELEEYGRGLSLLRDDPTCLKAALAP